MMMQDIEQYALDKFISDRQQFGEKRYEVKTESVLFEQKETIREASAIFKSLYGMGNNFFMNALEKQIQKLSSAIAFQYVKNEILETNNQSSLFSKLQQLLKDNQIYSNKEQSIENAPINQNFIILELSLLEQNTLLSLNQQDQKQFIKKMVKQQLNTNYFFWKEQTRLAEKHRSIAQNRIRQLHPSDILVILVGLPANQNEIEKYFNQEFFLLNEVLTITPPEVHDCRRYNPLNIFNNFFRQEIGEIINYLDREGYNKITLKQQLLNLKISTGETPIETYFRVCEIINICKEIVSWNKIIGQSFKCYDFQVVQEEESLLQNCREELFYNYGQLEMRFQDDFLQYFDNSTCKICKDDITCKKCQQAADNLEIFQNTQSKDITGMEQTKGKVLYYRTDDGMALYQKVHLNPNKLNFLASIKFSKDKNFNLGEFGQIVLVDKEEGQKVVNLNFDLKPQTIEFIQMNQKFPQILEIIFDYLLRIMAVKSKGVILNPILRLNPHQARLVI